MTDTIIVRAPGQSLADTMDPSVSIEDAEIDALLTEAETRMRESVDHAATAVTKHRFVLFTLPLLPLSSFRGPILSLFPVHFLRRYSLTRR